MSYESLQLLFEAAINVTKWRNIFKNDVGAEEKENGIKPLVMYFHTQMDTLMSITPDQFHKQELPSLLKQGLGHQCRFYAVWRSATGQAYRVVYHEFSFDARKLEWGPSNTSLIVGMGLTGKRLCGDLVYAELIPITDDKLLVALSRATNVECAFCLATGCLDKCDSCSSTFCSPEHRNLHVQCEGKKTTSE